MILGLDVSTSRIGWAIINDKQELIDSDFYKTKAKTPLEERATALKDNVLKPIMTIRRYQFSEVRVEEPFSIFSGGKDNSKNNELLSKDSME